VLRVWRGHRTMLAVSTAAVCAGLTIALLTPLLWTSWRPRWLPWPLESYVNGVHNLGEPQPWLFPIFPWTAFAFLGLATGLVLLSNWAKKRMAMTVSLVGVFGVFLVQGARWADSLSFHLYPVYDFWHTSPAFFLIRIGILLVILLTAYAWCRWGLGQRGFSPLIQLGQTSLLVYWVHIEFVYGRLSILRKHAMSIRQASIGLASIFLAMLLLSIVRTRLKARKKAARSPARHAVAGNPLL
jgi:hypothetical protein